MTEAELYEFPLGQRVTLWLDTGNRQYLDDSVLYNEDDCRATKLIKDWMASGNAEEVGQVI